MRATSKAAGVAIVAAALAGCGVKFQQDGGWTTITLPGIPPSLQYKIPAGGNFVVLCDPDANVTFSLLGGGNRPDIDHFAMSTGGWHHSFQNYHAAKNALVMLPTGDTGSPAEATDRLAIERALAATTAPIVISSDDGWSRTVPASPEIGKFAAGCHASKKS